MTPPEPHQLLEHADFLRRLARSLVGDMHLAEDVVQETIAAALEARERPRNLRAWLAGVVRKRVLGQRRTAARRRRRELAAAKPEHVDGPAEAAEQLEVQERIVRLVRGLEEPLRATVD